MQLGQRMKSCCCPISTTRQHGGQKEKHSCDYGDAEMTKGESWGEGDVLICKRTDLAT